MLKLERPDGLPDCIEWRSFTGKVFNLLDPDPALICAADLGHHLAYTCRWNGGVPRFYSVAEHSLRGMLLVPKAFKLPFLCHDGHEMPLGDLCSPVKDVLRYFTTAYDWIAQTWDQAIATAFDFDVRLMYSETVSWADVAMRGLERKHLLGLPVTLEDSIAMQGLVGDEWREGTAVLGMTEYGIAAPELVQAFCLRIGALRGRQ